MECLQTKTISTNDVLHEVPCGKCAFCLSNNRAQWMFRIYHEIKNQDQPGWFLTLTYNQRCVPLTSSMEMTLRFRHVQLFIKKLRKGKFYVKYICVGEYGSKTRRPHYHLLLWTSCPAEALQRYWSNKKNMVRGEIHVGRISMESAMYTLKYIIQPKQKQANGLEKTRAQFSRGLGLSYLSSSVYDYHTYDYENPELLSMIEGKKVALPRYYKNKIFTKYQMRREAHAQKWRAIKAKRMEMRKLKRQGIANTLLYRQALRVETSRRLIEKQKVNQKL